MELEKTNRKLNTNRVIIHNLIDYFKAINIEILEFIKTTKSVEDVYLTYIRLIKNNNEIIINPKLSEEVKNGIDRKYKRVIYELYSFENDMQNQLSLVVHGSRVFSKHSFDDYFKNQE